MCCLRSCIYEPSCKRLLHHKMTSVHFPGSSFNMGDYASLILCPRRFPSFHAPTRSYTNCVQFVGKVLKTPQPDLFEVSPASVLLGGQPLTSLHSEFSLDSKVGSFFDAMLILELYEHFLKMLSKTSQLLRILLPHDYRRP